VIRRVSASSASPLSWWLLALSLAVLAGASQGALIQVAIATFALGTVVIFREDAPWSRSVRFYIFLASFVVAARVLFRIIFNIQDGGQQTALALPALTINLGFGPPVTLFGNVSFEALESGATDGLRLAAIIVSIGMASSLANPRQLLKSTPSALYEIASAISVAINLAPQLIESLQRVRRARALRGRSKGLGSMAGTVIPVLEDAIDSSLSLAASMDSRGFGRRGHLSNTALYLARAASLTAASSLAIGSFLILAGTSQPFGFWVLLLGLFSSYLTVRLNSKAKIRTRFEKQVFGRLDAVVFGLSMLLITLAIGGWFR
jgi:energy-coupling factor transport system permease protein